MKVEQINSFLVLSEKLNFTKASAELYVAQPSLSRNIALLEEEIGGQLFRRNKHGVSLTALGRAFLPYAQSIKSAHNEAETFAIKTKKGLREMHQEVRIGIGVYQFMDFFLTFIAEMSNIMPNLSFSVEDGLQSEMTAKLKNEKLDLIFTSEHSLQQAPEFETLPLFTTPLMLVVAVKHRLAGRDGPVSIQEINECGLPVFTLEPTMRPYLKKAFPDLEITQLNSIVRCLQLVEAGMGIAIFPGKIQELSNRAVRYVTIRDYPIKLNMVAAWKKRGTAQPWWDTFIIAASNYIENYSFL